MVADKLSTNFKNKIDTKDFNMRNSICLPKIEDRKVGLQLKLSDYLTIGLVSLWNRCALVHLIHE